MNNLSLCTDEEFARYISSESEEKLKVSLVELKEQLTYIQKNAMCNSGMLCSKTAVVNSRFYNDGINEIKSIENKIEILEQELNNRIQQTK